MMPEEDSLQERLQSALARAGIVMGYSHVCRRKECRHSEWVGTPSCGVAQKRRMKLWPRPKFRPIRFDDLRHTTASLFMMAGANPAALQHILRHGDPRLTTEVYGHMAPQYLRREIDLRAFGRPAS